MLKITIACALSAALSLLRRLGFAEDAPPLHQGAWPIPNWHDHQPTQNQLNVLHLHDVAPDQAREVDRLHDQLLSRRTKILKQHPALEH